MEFRHPKYYKELRKRNKLDQAISLRAHDGERERATGPGPKPQATTDTTASGLKLQATSSKLRQKRIASLKPQAASFKPQAASYKFLDP